MLNTYLQIDLKAITNYRVVAFTLICGLLGFVANLFPVPLFADLTLIFGPAFSLLVALSIGPWAGLVCAAITTSALLLVWDHAYAYLVFVPEAFVVGWLYHRQWNELLAVAVYGLVIGIIFVLASFFMFSDSDYALDLVGAYLLNSFLYTLVASALLWLFSVPKWLKLDFNRTYTLRTQIFTILIISMTIPLAALSVFETKNDQHAYLLRVNNELNNANQIIAHRLSLYLKENRLAIQKQAELLGLYAKNKLSSSSDLHEFHLQHPSFITTLVADPAGLITAYSSLSSSYSGIQQYVSDRDYFREAMLGNVYVSPAFKGRAPGNNPIVAISAPIKNDKHQVIAILEGSLNLELFASLVEHGGSMAMNKEVVIVDANQQVVYRTSGIDRRVLDHVNWFEHSAATNNSFRVNNLMQEQAISAVEMLPNNWQVFSFYSIKDFNAYSRHKYRNLGLALFIIIIIMGSLAAFLSYQINGPISWLLKRTINFNINRNNIKPIKISPLVPREMVTLIRAHESAERRLSLAFKSEQMHQLKRASAEKASEAKSDFLSSMSHELRTPLNAISGFSQLLNADETLQPDAKSMASEIHVASQYLMLLINDILDMSKIESGKLELVSEEVELEFAFQQALPLLRGLAEVNQVEIVVRPFQSVVVIADMLRLKQVIINIVSNAIKYNRHKGKVFICVKKMNDVCCLEISDTGHGIEQSRVDEIFQPFNRLAQERSNIEGFGIGLSVTKKLLAMMGGKIEVESQLGSGSCFRVYLPLVERVNQDTKVSQPEFQQIDQLDLQPCKVLYVEDNHLNALVMQKAMSRFPQIEYAHEPNGQRGIERLKQQAYDVVLLDITLPDISGYEVLHYMQEQLADNYQYVFAVSANAMTDDINKGLAEGFHEYVTKPIDFKALFDLLQQYQTLLKQSD